MVLPYSHKVPRVSWYSGSHWLHSDFAYGAFTLSGWLSQNHSAILMNTVCGPNPGMHALRFGLFPVRSPLLRKSRGTLRSFCFLFLRVLRCFSSPGSPPYVIGVLTPYWRMDDRSFSCRVSPFRHLRVTGYVLLSAAFRSLSRLSSAPSAKASALRSYLLDLLLCMSPCNNGLIVILF